MANYRGGLGRVSRGRRTSAPRTKYGSQTFQSGAMDFAGEMLEGAVDTTTRILAQREQRKQQEQRREDLAVARMAQQARDDQDALITAEMNRGMADLAVERQAEGYMPPEGEVVGSDDPIRPLDAGERAEITTQLAEAKSEEASAALELEQETMENATKEQRKQARMSASAFRSAESRQKAVEARDNRVRGMEETEAYRAQGQDISAQVAQGRAQDKAEAAVEKLRAKLDDDGKLYASMMTEVRRDRKEEGLRVAGRRAEDEMEEEARERMFAARAKSGVYKADMEGNIVFDEAKALEIAASVIEVPVVKPGARYTEEDWANAKRVRYTMPADMMDWKPGTWEAMGLDNATALQMASAGAQQRLRWSRQQPVASLSGRSESVDARSSLGGITGSSSPPAGFAPDDEEAEKQALAIAGIASSTLDPDEPESPEGAGAPPPPGPAPAEAAGSPPAPPPPAEPLPQEAPIEGAEEAQELAAQSDVDIPLEDTLMERAAGLASHMIPGGVRDAFMEKSKREAAEKAQTIEDLQVELGSIDEKDWSEEAKANKAMQITKKLNVTQYGADIANVIDATIEQVKRKVADGMGPEEAQEWARTHLEKMITARSQEARGEKLGARAQEAEAAWKQMNDILTDPKEFGKFVLTTGVPMAIATATGVAGVGLVGQLALTAFAAGGTQLAMEGGVLDEEGRLDWDRIRSAGIEGATSVTEVGGMKGLAGVVKKAAGKGFKGAVTKYGLGAAIEGIEEPFQQTLASLWDKGKLPSAGELKVAAALGAGMGAAFTAVIPGAADGDLSAKDRAKYEKNLDTALKLVRERAPHLFDADLTDGMDVDEMTAEIAQYAPEIEAKLAEQIAPQATDAQQQAAFEAAAEGQAIDLTEATAGVEEAIAQDVAAKESAEAKVKERATVKPAKEQEVGGAVAGPTEVAPMLPKAAWTKVDNDTSETTVNGVRLRVQVNSEGLKLEAADAKETYGKEGEVEAIGLFTPRESLKVGAADLIQVAAGQGRRTGGHELVHFFKLNGLLAKKDWATLSTRYEKQARALSTDTAWAKLSNEQKETYREEAVADALGEYAVKRFGDKDVKVPKALRKIYDTVRGFALKASGKSEVEFEKILRGEFEKGNARAATQASADRARRASVAPAGPIAVEQEGWTGVRNRQTGTIGLQGPDGAKVAGKLEAGVFNVKSIGKGSAKSSQGLVEAIRKFAAQRGATSIVMSSSQAELTADARKWRENMIRRGDANYNADGKFEISLAPSPPADARAMIKASVDAVKTRKGTKVGDIVTRTKAEVVSFINSMSTDLTGLDEKAQVRKMATQLAREIRYQQKQVKSGAGWYRGDIIELEHAAKKAFPELADPEMMDLFKVLGAATSFGNRPNQNMEQTFEIWKGFKASGFENFPSRQTSGKEWAGSPVFGQTGEKLIALKRQVGSWQAVVGFMKSQHTVGKLRGMGFHKVSGKATDLAWGSRMLGPKGNSFFQNLIGNMNELTADVWWTRTFNRVRGTDVEPEAPRNDSERALMRKTVKAVAGRAGVSAADAQAMLWFAEQDLWTKLGLPSGSGSYAVGGRKALESFRAGKEATTEVSAASAVQVPRTGTTLGVELAFSPDSTLRQKYDWDKQTPKVQQAITDQFFDRLLPMIAADTGVVIEGDVRSWATTETWGKNPNAVIRVSGTPGQVKQAAQLLALAAQQDSVAVSRPDPNGDPTAFVRVRKGLDLSDGAVLDDIADRFQANLPRIGEPLEIWGIAADVAANGTPMLKAFGPGVAQGGATVQTALKDAVLAAAPQADISAGTSNFAVEFPGNNWKENPDGRELSDALDDQGYSPDFVDDFKARAASELDTAWNEHTGTKPPTPGPRAAVARPSAASDTRRRATLPILEQLKKIKSASGRAVGKLISTQVSSRQEYMERKLARNRHGYRKALTAFKKLEGKNWPASWDQVVSALDGEGKFKSLNPAQKRMYLVARAIFNTVKTDAIQNGTFTGQIIFKYFPHMRTDLAESDPVQDHADWLRENDPVRLESLKEKDSEWMEGILGEASDYELAAKDMNQNWKSERWWKANAHLEKHRGAKGGDIRRDTDVLLDYLDSAYPRIATARYFGPKSEVINEAMASLQKDSDDFRYVHDSLKQILGFGQRSSSLMGRGASALGREIQTLAGLTKLGMAAIPQLTQIGPAVSEAARPGFLRGARSVLQGGAALVRSGEAYANAGRAGSLIAADIQGGSEIQRAQYGAGTGTFTEAAFKKVFSLGGLIPAGERIVTSTYGVVTLDKAARVIADSIGRASYINAVKAGDRVMLLDLLGTNEMVDSVLNNDAKYIDQIEKAWKEGRLDEEQFEPRMARPAQGDPQYVGRNLGYKRGVENMDRAAKRYTDKTQYRTRVQDAPLAFQAPMLKWSNTFLSFMYQHWNWQKTHFKAVANTSLSGAERKGHARTLMLQNLLMAPLLGQVAFSARALLTGRGNDEEDEYSTPLEAFDAVMGLDPIAKFDELGIALRYAQGWQYAGGIGYPTTIIERWRRAAEKSDPYRGLSGLFLGAPGESVFDATAFAVEATKFAEKWADGRATNADRRKIKRLGWRMTSHTTPNQFGLMGGVRREAGATESYPNFNPGWLGLLWDPEATWNVSEGVTSPAYREAREDRKYDLEDKRAAERERALDDAYDRENPR